MAKFVKVKKQLSDLLPGDPVSDAITRLTRLREFVGQVELAGRKYTKTYPLGMITEEDDSIRVRILRQSEMLADLEKERKTVKWGYYLRVPEVLNQAFDRSTNISKGLVHQASFKRGSKTHLNDFYHVTHQDAQRFGIEPEFLRPLLKSPGDAKTIRISPDALPLSVFVCRKTEDDLRVSGKSGALSYIAWGKSQTKKGVPYPEWRWVRERKPGWYSLPENESPEARIFLTNALGDRHLHKYSETAVIADKRLHVVLPNDGVHWKLLIAVLNSSLVAASAELVGRTLKGDGVLEVDYDDLRNHLMIPVVSSFTSADAKRILDAFKKVVDRPVESIFHEIKKADRIALDSAVLKAVGLDPKKYLKPVYDALCELVRERVQLGQMRGKARKTKARGTKAEKKAIEEVLDELLPNGPRRFPNDFFSGTAASGKKTLIELPEAPLVFDHSPLFTGVHTEDDSFSHSVRTPAEGKFLLYAQRSGHSAAEVPEKVVEISRTVANYESYLRELRKELYDAYYRRTLDTRTAARLTQSAFERFRLPQVEA